MKALVLCAGYGTRLGALTRDTPKPMLPIAGEPLLAWTLRYLSAYGFTDIAINLHYRPESIKTYFKDGSAFGVRIHYSLEEVLLGTAGALKRLEAYLRDSEDFLVLYGDLLIDQDLQAMVQFHRQRQALGTLLLHQRPGSNSNVQLDADGRIVTLLERPSPETQKTIPWPWVNSGVQLLNRGILKYIPDNRPCDLPRDVYMPLVARERLLGFPLTGYRCAIDSTDRYEEAQSALTLGRYQFQKPLGARPLASSVRRYEEHL